VLTHLLASLQEYVAGALETQQQQERELSKLRAQQKEAERVSEAVLCSRR
jgi:hypothetical protein